MRKLKLKPEIVSIDNLTDLAAMRTDKSNSLSQSHIRFANLIRSLRGNRTQRDFADALSEYTPGGNSIKQTSIASYENAKALPSLDTFYALAKFTGITCDELLAKIFVDDSENQAAEMDGDFHRILSLINFLPLEKILLLGKACIERLDSSNTESLCAGNFKKFIQIYFSIS